MANAGISGSDVRDMMLEAVEKRFGGHRAPQPIEILSDNVLRSEAGERAELQVSVRKHAPAV